MDKPLSDYEIDDEIGSYVILRVLSRNCFGSTFLCCHTISDKRMIIKAFPPGLENDPGFQQRFEITREQLTNFIHPNILVTRMMGMFRRQPFAVLDYLQGRHEGTPLSLQEIFNDSRPLRETVVIRLALQIGRALAFAHACRGGIVHCNLKPANILFAENGDPMISEFGLLNLIGQNKLKELVQNAMDESSVFDPAEGSDWVERMYRSDPNESGSSSQRWNEALAETLAYMSPEQRLGDPVTPQSNIYSFGLILYTMLTGQMFCRESSPMPSTFGINPRWDSIITRCIALDPAQRYLMVSDLLAAIERVRPRWDTLKYMLIITPLTLTLLGGGWLLFQVALAEGNTALIPFVSLMKEHRNMFLKSPHLREFSPPDVSMLSLPDAPVLTSYWAVRDLNLILAPIPPTTLSFADFSDSGTLRVRLTRPAWMGIHEVTQAQFLAITGDDPSLFRHPEGLLPAGRVTWPEAVHFCHELTRRERLAGRLPQGMVYRLPTEAEWLSALLADETYAQFVRRFQQNNDAWHSRNSNQRPRKPALLQPNPWGFYDLNGNMKEWCYDRFALLPEGDVEDYAGPEEPDPDSNHVVCGGSFLSDSEQLGPRSRESYPALTRSPEIGFRVLLGEELSPED